MKILLEAGANILNGEVFNIRKPSGHSALMRAAESGHINVVRYLLDSGSNFRRERGYDQKTALDLARDNGHEEVAKLLLNAENLMEAVENGRLNVARSLLGHDTNPNWCGDWGCFYLVI